MNTPFFELSRVTAVIIQEIVIHYKERTKVVIITNKKGAAQRDAGMERLEQGKRD